MNADESERIALLALSWLVADEELCGVFLGATGASAEDLRGQAGEPAFLASVLDFLTMDDAWVMAFCDAQNLPYETPMRARQAMPGAEQVHWT